MNSNLSNGLCSLSVCESWRSSRSFPEVSPSPPGGAAVGPWAGAGGPALAAHRDLGRYWQLACTGRCRGSWRHKGDFERKSYAELAKIYGKNKSPVHETVKKELEVHARLLRLRGRGDSHNFYFSILL